MQVYLIGLKDNYRGAALEAQLRQAEISFIRSNGVSGLHKGMPLDHFADQVTAKRVFGAHLTAGEIGCALAHLQVYAMFEKSLAEWAFVLEDDAVVVEQAQLKLVMVHVAQTAIPFPTIQLAYGTGIIASRQIEQFGGRYSIYGLLATPGVCTGYFVNREAALLLLKCSLPLISPADWPLRSEQKIGFRAIFPWLIVPSGTATSTIGKRNVLEDARFREALRHSAFSAQGVLDRLRAIPFDHLRIFWSSNIRRHALRKLMGPGWTYQLGSGDEQIRVAKHSVRILSKILGGPRS